MEINIVSLSQDLPLERVYVVNMVIKSFKGRKDVEVHLYRSAWDPEEEAAYDWESILGKHPEQMSREEQDAIKVIMESFDRFERDELVQYLQTRYAQKISAINSAPLPFPIPQGLIPLRLMPEDENHGRIRLEKVPNYTLDFSVHGYYDLSDHPPILEHEQD